MKPLPSAISETGLLRLAIAKGLLHWEDLDSIAGHLEPLGERGGAPAVDPLDGRYVRALIAAGFLSRESAAELLAELERGSHDLTPNLLAPIHPTDQGQPPASAPGLDLPPDLRFLARWPRYRVQAFVGSGGMGTAYKAFDPHLNRFVALKFLHRNDPVQTARFLREARAQARVEHPNVCQVFEVGEVEGRPYIAMQYVDGRPLNALRETLSLEEKVRVVRDVAWAVHAAHRTGLIHRDLKPGNVLVARDEDGIPHPYVVDFGLALDTSDETLSAHAVLGGTPAYISPEAASGQALDARSDVYSLGVLLYELLAGARPFAGLSLANVLVRIAQEEAVPLRKLDPALPRDLETIVQRCMEKDRVQRYPSARDLAEDLARFLDGDPIQARPASWGYRVRKRLRKNRGTALFAAGALAALALLAAANLRSQLRAREQAELARRFGERIGRLEADMRLEAYLPLHAVTPRKAELRRDLDAIRTEMKGLGAIAEGPGHEALGKGYLALHLYEPAFQHLELAWKLGQRNGDLAEAMGEAGGFLYEHALTELGLSPEGKAAARADLERATRKTTLAVLRQAMALEGGDSPYLRALAAFYEKRYPETIAFARKAYEADPRLYRAAQLEARVWAAQGDAAADGGRYDEALAHYDRAGAIYGQVLGTAPSEASLYLGDCSRRARRLEVGLLRGGLAESELEGALGACRLALAVDPEIAGALTLEASMIRYRGDERRRHGDDPTVDFTRSIELARAASRLAPGAAQPFNNQAFTLRLLAQWQLDHGVDPSATIAQGLAAARRAVELEPELAEAHNILATAYLVQEQSQGQRGIDPRPALAAAIRSCERARQLNPRYLLAHINLGNAWKASAEADVARGTDPTGAVIRSAAAFQRALALDPNRAATYNNLGNTYLTLGEYQAARGGNALPAFSKAAESYRRAVAIKPGYALAHYNLVYTLRSLAQGRLDRDADPTGAIADAETALARALALNPEDSDTYLEKARILLLAGRWQGAHGGAAEVSYRAAESALARAETLNPQQAEVYYEQARLDRLRCEAQPAAGRPWLDHGLAKIERSVAINPGEGRYLALRGVLQTLAAEPERVAARRDELLRQARASFEEAVRRNPLLASEVAPWVQRARNAGGVAPL